MAELKELAEFYARAAAMKDPVIKCGGPITIGSPDVDSNMKNWTVEERQPDFRCLIDSGIDCEFSNNDGFPENSFISKLSKINSERFKDARGGEWRLCRPRLNHIHAWIATKDSKCPVPDGYSVSFEHASGFGRSFDPCRLNWTNSDYKTRIVYFEVREK